MENIFCHFRSLFRAPPERVGDLSGAELLKTCGYSSMMVREQEKEKNKEPQSATGRRMVILWKPLAGGYFLKWHSRGRFLLGF